MTVSPWTTGGSGAPVCTEGATSDPPDGSNTRPLTYCLIVLGHGDRWDLGERNQIAQTSGLPPMWKKLRGGLLHGEWEHRNSQTRTKNMPQQSRALLCSDRSICKPYGPELRSTRAWPASSNRARPERSTLIGSASQSAQAAPSRAARACSTPKQWTHSWCVSPAVKNLGQGYTHRLNCPHAMIINTACDKQHQIRLTMTQSNAEEQKAISVVCGRPFLSSEYAVTYYVMTQYQSGLE